MQGFIQNDPFGLEMMVMIKGGLIQLRFYNKATYVQNWSLALIVLANSCTQGFGPDADHTHSDADSNGKQK